VHSPTHSAAPAPPSTPTAVQSQLVSHLSPGFGGTPKEDGNLNSVSIGCGERECNSGKGDKESIYTAENDSELNGVCLL